jgi:hypothetical protein
VFTLAEFRCFLFFLATLFVDVSMDYASAEEKFGANVLLEILDFPFKKSVC